MTDRLAGVVDSTLLFPVCLKMQDSELRYGVRLQNKEKKLVRKRIMTIASILLLAAISPAEQTEPLDGFTAESSVWQQQFESKLQASLKPANAERLLKELTSRPHRAGTEGARITAEFIKNQLIKYDLPAEILTYQAFLPSPVSVSVELTSPVHKTIPTTEDRIEGDPFTETVEQHPGWAGYSPSGEASGAVVYAHHGSNHDFQIIQQMGIDLKGKIVLMRYFGTGEGTKVKNAERAGAAGILLYSDPKEDGYRYGDVYPKGNWRPPGGIMRRSVIPLWYDGDPLSPGWSSVSGAKRLSPGEIDLPKIPVIPISYRSAELILQNMEGPLAPHHMQGDLPLPYKIGPGPAEIRMKAVMDNQDLPILNVVSRIEGDTYPDQWVIVGNHHDAWIYGAGDPSSGTASLLEFARGLGELMKQGYRPKRTMILAFWDAEEMLLGGSTEWVEHHKEELLKKAVACINMDSSVFNTDRPLSVSAHPVLHKLFREVTGQIADPKTGKTMFDAWVHLQNQYRQTPGVDGWGSFFDPNRELKEPWIFESPSDDAAPFFHQLALPASDMYYGADYGMYHSIYENFHWMKTVVDPTFEYHIAMSLLQGFVALRIANADLLQLDYATEAGYWKMGYDRLIETAKGQAMTLPLMEETVQQIELWQKQSVDLDRAMAVRLKQGTKMQKDAVTEFNRMYFLAARDFYRPSGFPNSRLERNLWSGSDGILPGISGALERKEEAKLAEEASLYLNAIKQRVASLRALQARLSDL